MSKENKSIHEFDFNLICEYFSVLERQGPGSQEVTLKALSFIDNLTDESRIADIGCGTGGQTLVLAQKAFLKKYAGNKTAEELIENQQHEAELYAKYKEFYGYVFYIGKKI